MTLVFLSNRFTNHQKEISNEFVKLFESYFFIECEPEEIRSLPEGKKPSGDTPSYVFKLTEVENLGSLVVGADVVIFGSCSQTLVKHRLKLGKLTFKYSERIFKTGIKKWQIPLRVIKDYFRYNRFKNFYLLCASAYAYSDYALSKSFINKSYKWGYFPSASRRTFEEILSIRNNNKVPNLLWIGRFIDWKHPELAIMLAENLKNAGYYFVLSMAGFGPMLTEIKKMVADKQLEDYIIMHGSITADKAIEMMEMSDIFVQTSDFNEGWGAVLNEAMSCGCCVVASHAIGAVPYLLKHNINGLIFKNGSLKELMDCVIQSMKDVKQRQLLGQEAYLTMKKEWHPQIAATRFYNLVRSLLSNDMAVNAESGPCSKAVILENNWM